MDSLTRHEEVQRGRIVAFARATLGDADYLQLVEEIGQFLEQTPTLPSGELPLDWMHSNKFYPTDHEYRKLLGGAIFANGRAFMARESGDADGAVLFMLMAENFFGQAERAFRAPKISSKKGGKVNGDRYEPLRLLAHQLAMSEGGNFYTLKKLIEDVLIPAVLTKASEIPLSLSKDRLPKTISEWLIEKGFEHTPRTRSRGP